MADVLLFAADVVVLAFGLGYNLDLMRMRYRRIDICALGHVAHDQKVVAGGFTCRPDP